MRLSVVLSFALAAGHQVAAAPSPSNDKGLHALAQARGKLFGTAVNGNFRNDQPYGKSMTNTKEFGMLAPENAMKVGTGSASFHLNEVADRANFQWSNIQPEREDFRWGAADEVVQFARTNGQALRCGPLVFGSDSSTPEWGNIL